MTTQKDVASLAGVSVSTVSRVVNGLGIVDDDTRERVEAAIRELNYKPNLVAYGLRSRTSKLLGVILPELNHNWYARLAQYIEESGIEHGYGLLIGLHHNESELEMQLIDEFQRRNVDGLILSISVDQNQRFHYLKDLVKVPAVLLQYGRTYGNMSNIEGDNYKAGRMVAEFFLELGHRKICCTIPYLTLPYVNNRFNGFRDRLLEEGLPFETKDVFYCGLNYQRANRIDGERAIEVFFDERPEAERPTAIWGHNDNVAAAMIRELHKRGIRIPEEVSIVGMDNMAFSDMTYPSLTTVSQSEKELAETAVRILCENIESGGGLAPENILMEPKLICRESAGRCRKQ